MAEKTCRCGHGKNHPMVVREADYSLWGWILLSLAGMTPKPKQILFRCTLCRTVIATSRNPRDLLGPKAVRPEVPNSSS